MILVPGRGAQPEPPRSSPAADITGGALVRFEDVLSAVHLRRDPDGTAAARHVADVFNARGFFAEAGAVPAPAPPRSAPASVPSAPVPASSGLQLHSTTARAIVAPPPPAPAPPIAATETCGPAAATVSAKAVPSQLAQAGHTDAGDRPAPRRQAHPASNAPTFAPVGPHGPRAASGVPLPAASSRVPHSASMQQYAAARASARPAADSGGAAPQVSLHAGETGIDIVARIDRLDERARVTLRARIAGLLSRNGVSGGVVRLIGSAATPTGQG